MRPDVPGAELVPGYRVPPILNGCWQLSAGHRRGRLDPARVLDGLRRQVEAGLDVFDCGDIYTGVEELLGDLLRRLGPQARRVRIHTKLVPDLDVLPEVDAAYVERIVDRSLRRLGRERLDMVQLAWWDHRVPRYVETAGWLDRLRRKGKIRLLGATNFDTARLREILDAGVPLAAHQVQYSLLDRRPAGSMTELCAERGVALLAYGSLAGGFLSDRWLDRPDAAAPPPNRSLVKYRLIIEEAGGWDRHQALLRALAAVARRHGAGIADVAARWVLDRPGVRAVIIGSAGGGHLEENLRTLRLRLDDDDRRSLRPFEESALRGEVYALERDREGPHGAIMRYDLNREAD